MTRFWRPTKLPIDPFGTPDRGFATFRVTSPYGEREDPLNPGRTVFHGGLDIGNARLGDTVTAIGPGKVYLASPQPSIPWSYPSPPGAAWPGPSYGGNVIVINHGGGLFSQYAHLGRMDVRFGDTVSVGQAIGIVGESGSAYRQGHLHFGIRDTSKLGNGHDGFVDPWPLIQAAEDDVLASEAKFVKAPWRARARSRSSIRTDTRIADDTLDGVLDEGAEVTVVATKEGSVFSGDRTWWVFGVEGKGLRCVHATLLERLPAPVVVGDCTEQVNAAVQQAVAPLNDQIDRIRQIVI